MEIKKIMALTAASAVLLTGCGKLIDNSKLTSDSSSFESIDSLEQPPASDPPNGIKLFTSDKFGVYDDITVKDIISKDVEPSDPDQIIDTSLTGQNTAVVEYTYKGSKYNSAVSYTVIDDTPPLVLHSGNGSEHICGEEFDISDYVGVGDNYDREPSITFTGDIDEDVNGDYPITVTASDKSGNKTEWDITIKVVSEKTVSEPAETSTDFTDIKNEYSEKGVSVGIDVSRWQGDIDFEAVKNAGCEFVYIRIGYYDDEYSVDSCFEKNLKNAKAAGLKTGVYIYTLANTEEEIADNAEWIDTMLDGEKTDLPVVFDWEEFSEFQKYKMSIHDINRFYGIFAEEMKKQGRTAMLYSSKNFLNDLWEEQTESPVWLAHYTDKTDYTGKYDMWQLCSDGVIDGIDGYVDIDIAYDIL